jgi:hypothetical protein
VGETVVVGRLGVIFGCNPQVGKEDYEGIEICRCFHGEVERLHCCVGLLEEMRTDEE